MFVAAVVGAAAARITAGAGDGTRRDRSAAVQAELEGLSALLAEQREVIEAQQRALERQSLSLTHLGDSVYEQDREIEALEGLFQDLAAGAAPRAVDDRRAGGGEVAVSGPSPYASPQGAAATEAGGAAAQASSGPSPYASASAVDVPPAMIEAARVALTEQRERERVEREQRELVERMQRAERQVGRLVERLALNETQQQTFSTLLFERDEAQRDAWRKVRSGELDRDEARALSGQATEAYEQALQQLLSPGQYAELQAHRAEREDGSRRRRGGG
jgi:hypothetical protein